MKPYGAVCKSRRPSSSQGLSLKVPDSASARKKSFHIGLGSEFWSGAVFDWPLSTEELGLIQRMLCYYPSRLSKRETYHFDGVCRQCTAQSQCTV